MNAFRRHLLAAAAATLLPGRVAQAQADWQRVAVPVVTPPDFVQSVWRHHGAVRSARLVQAAGALLLACRALKPSDPAALATAQQAWRDALQAWAGLAAVAIGPLLDRRSARRIDFAPTRPEQVKRAITRLAAAGGRLPPDEVGASAKGLGALEWLLWAREAPRDADAQRYAVFVAEEVAAEAAALAAAFEAGAERERSDEETVAAFAEIVNQWLGGLEALRLAGFERPRSEARQRRQAQASLPRALSGAGALERAARGAALQALAVFDASAGLRAGQGLVPFETLLRGRGLNPLADRLVQAAGRAAAATAGSDLSAARLQAGARALADLKHLAEAELAPALDVRVGFSDVDGD